MNSAYCRINNIEVKDKSKIERIIEYFFYPFRILF